MTYTYHPNDYFYDIESLEDAFTYARFNPNTNTATAYVLWGKDQLERLSDNDINKIKQKIYEVNPDFKAKNIKLEIKNGVTELMEHLVPLFVDQLSGYHTLSKVAENYTNAYGERLSVNPFVDETNENDRSIHTFQFGFNSKAYDMPMTAYIIDMWAENKLPVHNSDWANTSSHITPSKIKKVSNSLIQASFPSQAPYFGYNEPSGKILNAMTTSARFADVRLLLGKSGKLTLGLKRYAAQAGWTILESELVKGSDSLHRIADEINKQNPDKTITAVDLLADVLAYNFVDVLNTKNLFELSDWQTGFTQHLQLLERYEKEFEGKLYVDSTNSKFIEYVIVPNNGGKPVKLQDSETIDLTFPTNQGDVNMLELAHQMGLPDEIYNFYKNFDGATSVKDGLESVKADPALALAREEGRLNENGTTLDIWVPKSNGELTNAHVNVSIGGGHGEYANRDEYLAIGEIFKTFDLEQKVYLDYFDTISHQFDNVVFDESDETKDAKKREKAIKDARLELTRLVKDNPDATLADLPIASPVQTHNHPLKTLATVNSKRITAKENKIKWSQKPADYVKTVYAKDTIHADVDSLYPSLLTLLRTLLRQDGVDVYAQIREERLEIKFSLPEHKSDYTDEDWKRNAVQLLLKLLLNSATGAADANFDTNILVSNKITAMRIIGNLLITLLSIKLSDIGGEIVSINTDGLYVNGISEDEADAVIQEWKELFQLSASPEKIDKFISKDSNNRLEMTNGKIDYAGGASFSAWKEPSMTKSVSKPAMLDETLVHYLASQDYALREFDHDKAVQYMQYRIATAKSVQDKAKLIRQFQWIFNSSPYKNRFMTFYNTKTGARQLLPNISRTFLVKPEYSDDIISLMTVAKKNGTDDPEARQLIDDENIKLTYERGQHLRNEAEARADDLINEITALTKTNTPDLPQWFDEHESQLQELADVMGMDPARYAPLAWISDLTTFKKKFTEEYKKTLKGTNSRILRAAFETATRVLPDMRFVLANDNVEVLAQTDLLSKLDLNAYADLVENEWSVWAADFVEVG